MKKLSIKKLSDYLGKVVEHNIQSSLMIWGAPGLENPQWLKQLQNLKN